VKSIDATANQITVARADGSEVTYDPRRQQGVSLYRDQEKAFSVGDRIQFTAPANDLKIANRELGTIQGFTDDGHMTLKMDSGRSLSLDPREHPHLDHGYAVTSHSSQGKRQGSMRRRHQILRVGDLDFVLWPGLQNPFGPVLLVAAANVQRAADVGRKVVPLDRRKREREPCP
jgi:hypothetical protein